MRIVRTNGRNGMTNETSILLYIGKPTWIVFALHRQKNYFMSTWYWEFTRYPKSGRQDG